MITEVILTQLGETMNEGTIASWNKKVGEKVEKGDEIASIETDKATLGLESPASGYLVEILVQTGQTAPVLSVLGYLADSPDERPAGQSIESTVAAQSGQGTTVAAAQPSAQSVATQNQPGAPMLVSPAARRIAREHGIDCSLLKGTGPRGRVVEADVVRAIAEAAQAKPAASATPAITTTTALPSATPEPVVAASGEGFVMSPLSRIRKITAERLAESYRQAVHVTLETDVDMVEAARLRGQLSAEWERKEGVKVTYTDLIVKAVARALEDHHKLNSAFTPEGIRENRSINIGVAMAIPSGLIVPVVPNADKASLFGIARVLRALTDKARAGSVSPDEMRGGTFTITNMGTLGIDHFTPIINTGEGAILGVGRIIERAVVRDGQVVARLTAPLSLSFDHRLVDGADGALFLARVREVLESPYLILV